MHPAVCSAHFNVSVHLLTNHLKEWHKIWHADVSRWQYPRPTSMPMGIVVISWVCPSTQPSVGLSLGIVDISLGRNGLDFGMLMYPDYLPSVHRRIGVFLSVCPFVRPVGFVFVGVRVGVKLGVSCHHYWRMAVAITGGYGDTFCHYWQHMLVTNDVR